MTNDEKKLLISLVKKGYSIQTISGYVNCSLQTINKYIRIFRNKKIEREKEQDE